MVTRKHPYHGIIIRMHMDVKQIPVIKPCSFQMFIINLKSKRFNQVKRQMFCCTKSCYISCISRNFRLHQNYMHN